MYYGKLEVKKSGMGGALAKPIACEPYSKCEELPLPCLGNFVTKIVHSSPGRNLLLKDICRINASDLGDYICDYL